LPARGQSERPPEPIRVLLVCAGGMSSSLLESRIQKAAEAAGIALTVRAVPAGIVTYWNPDKIDYDLVLVAPQVRFAQRGIEKAVGPHGVIVQMIDSMAYGMADGEKILQQIVAAIKETE
jgi:PTS system cellobiose-specific IIB component